MKTSKGFSDCNEKKDALLASVLHVMSGRSYALWKCFPEAGTGKQVTVDGRCIGTMDRDNLNKKLILSAQRSGQKGHLLAMTLSRQPRIRHVSLSCPASFIFKALSKLIDDAQITPDVQ